MKYFPQFETLFSKHDGWVHVMCGRKNTLGEAKRGL